MKKIKQEFRTPPIDGLIVFDPDGTPTGIRVFPYSLIGGSNIIVRKFIPDLMITLFYTVSLNDDIDVTDLVSVPQVQFTESDDIVIGSPQLFGIPRENLLANQGAGYPSNFQSYIQIYVPTNLSLLELFITSFEAQLELIMIPTNTEK